MGVLGDAVHAEDFTGKVKARDLFATIIGNAVCLDSARTHCVYGGEGASLLVYVLTFLQGFATLDDVVQFVDIVRLQCKGKTETAESAIAAVYPKVMSTLPGCFWLTQLFYWNGHIGLHVIPSIIDGYTVAEYRGAFAAVGEFERY
jgi:hypothetical protein